MFEPVSSHRAAGTHAMGRVEANMMARVKRRHELMGWSLWPTSADGRRLAVSLSPTEPQPIIGHITKNQNETWSIEGDRTFRKFQGVQEAVRALIAESATSDPKGE
jgi:hypothetical protein